MVEKAVLHYAGLYKSALRNKQLTTLKENRGKSKNISFQFHYRKFSQQRYIKEVNNVNKRRRWRRSPLLSKTRKKCPDSRENCQSMG